MNRELQTIIAEVEKAVVGKRQVIEKILMALLADGHVLLDDIPGVGKTTLAVALSRTLGLTYNRIQFTPDVLPSDLTGFSVYEKSTEKFVFQPGALFCHLLLADEINRTSSKTQAALLEAMQEKQVAKIAEKIADGYKEGIRIVLISGPSSSGKTTFCKRLQVQLTTNLLHPVGISLDDYFLNREDTPKDEHGEYDFESLYALDLPYFNKDLKKLLSGEEIELPSFNFESGRRIFKGKKLKLRENSILVIEGIHALNPELTEFIDDKYKYRVYVSVLTSISLDNHNWIPTTDNRLLRRIIRDYRFRGYSAEDTINRWPSVRRGEDKWIFPYQENADAMFNSAMLYESAALRKYAEPILAQVPESNKANAEAYRLLRFLRYFNYIPTEELPGTSLLREFLGGGSFKY